MRNISDKIKEWRKNVKAYAVDIMGGRCKNCGYSKCQKALEFHHIDPSFKESLRFNNSGFSKIVDELKKCVLLCANCHREAHEYKIEYVPSFIAKKADVYLELYGQVTLKKVDWKTIDLDELKQKGMTNVAIASLLNVSETMVRKRLNARRAS